MTHECFGEKQRKDQSSICVYLIWKMQLFGVKPINTSFTSSPATKIRIEGFHNHIISYAKITFNMKWPKRSWNTDHLIIKLKMQPLSLPLDSVHFAREIIPRCCAKCYSVRYATPKLCVALGHSMPNEQMAYTKCFVHFNEIWHTCKSHWSIQNAQKSFEKLENLRSYNQLKNAIFARNATMNILKFLSNS